MQPLADLIAAISVLNPLQQKFLETSTQQLTPEDQALLCDYIDYCLAAGVAIDELARSYDLIVKDTAREQLYFARHHRYRYSTFAEVESKVYHNPRYMSRYMHGLALSAFLWPNHSQMFRYFRDALPAYRTGRYLEIGPGHGFYLMQAMRHSRFEEYVALDISATSIEMTRGVLSSGHFGKFDRFKLIQADFLAWSGAGIFDAVVMGEVLEHVEDPGRFLRRIAEISLPSTFIYVTTCFDAPAIDHIYHFSSMRDVEILARQAGLEVRDHLLTPYPGTTISESQSKRLPINVAMVLQKQQ